MFRFEEPASPPESRPVFQVHRRRTLTLAPPKRPSKATKHYCAFITKRILRELRNPLFGGELGRLQRHGCPPAALESLLALLETVSGPVRLLAVLAAADPRASAVFLDFGRWYLDRRYLRHLLTEARTEEQARYLQFKNQDMKQLFRRARA